MNGYCFEAFAGLTGSATKTIQRFKAQKMKKYGLSSAHTNCICWLARAGEEGLTQTELVRCEMMDPSQVSRVLRELSDKGYVRPGGEEGRYRRRYSLTEQGRQAAREIQGIIEEIRDFVIRDIRPEELAAFYSAFEKICEGLKRAEEVYLEKEE